MTRIDISAADAKAVVDLISTATDVVTSADEYDEIRKSYVVDADALNKLASAVDDPTLRRFLAALGRSVNL